MLINLEAALAAQASHPHLASFTRISAFRALTGIAAPAGGLWPPLQAAFYLLAVQARAPPPLSHDA